MRTSLPTLFLIRSRYLRCLSVRGPAMESSRFSTNPFYGRQGGPQIMRHDRYEFGLPYTDFTQLRIGDLEFQIELLQLSRFCLEFLFLTMNAQLILDSR